MGLISRVSSRTYRLVSGVDASHRALGRTSDYKEVMSDAPFDGAGPPNGDPSQVQPAQPPFHQVSRDPHGPQQGNGFHRGGGFRGQAPRHQNNNYGGHRGGGGHQGFHHNNNHHNNSYRNSGQYDGEFSGHR